MRALYTYTLCHNLTPESYDEAVAVACLQGLLNREAPSVYLVSPRHRRPREWLDVLTSPGRWLHDAHPQPLADLTALVRLAGPRLKAAVIWDPSVPASLNIATTIAGVEDAVVLSPEFADRYLTLWNLPILKDLRGAFTGAETGSAKNDAYRWAIRQYFAAGRCSKHFLCLYEDSFSTRQCGNLDYVVTRDWAVKNRSFVYDLSPWADEVPADDPHQPLGVDLATYTLLLQETLRQTAGREMTEVAGFFAFSKYAHMPDHPSRHEPVPTEWETVYLISPFNCYQNTVAHECYNQSLHSQAPLQPLQQHRPPAPPALENKVYLCILMADYDSATPLYDFLPQHWNDPKRGQIPLSWGINPNLLETYPDLIAHFYATASPNDYFVADASAAGYMNPNRIAHEHLPLFIRHNQRFFSLADMTIAPMVLDWDAPTPQVKDAFTRFAPDGFATIVEDPHQGTGRPPQPHVWKGMPVTILRNDAHVPNTPPEKQAQILSQRIIGTPPAGGPAFHYIRIVWTSPTTVVDSIAALKTLRPEVEIEVVDPHTFFHLFKQVASRQPA